MTDSSDWSSWRQLSIITVADRDPDDTNSPPIAGRHPRAAGMEKVGKIQGKAKFFHYFFEKLLMFFTIFDKVHLKIALSIFHKTVKSY